MFACETLLFYVHGSSFIFVFRSANHFLIVKMIKKTSQMVNV